MLQHANLQCIMYRKKQVHEEKCVCSVTVLSSVSSTKIEKEKREHAKQHGMIRTEITGAEIAEEMEKERRLFQLQMCEVGCKKRRTFLVVFSAVVKHQVTA